MADISELLPFVDKTKHCWLWNGKLDRDGYGYFKSFHNRVHRMFYESYVSIIPNGLVIDHICRTRNCVNPDHLEPVSIKENILRSPIDIATLNKYKKACNNGHAFTEENTYRRKDRVNRECKKCRNIAAKKWSKSHA